VAYLFEESFGGPGLRAINQVLRWLGVDKGTAFDEFDAAGLSRKRSTDEWALESAS
jgi:hypothetical protein